DEFARVLKPGGEIVLVSRVGAEAGLRRALERWFAPAARKLGWRTEFSWERYAEWAKRCRGMRLVERRAVPPAGRFSLSRRSRAGRHGRGGRGPAGGARRRGLTAPSSPHAMPLARRSTRACHIGFIESP